MIDIELQWLAHGEGLPTPTYATDGAAGLDVVAAESQHEGVGKCAAGEDVIAGTAGKGKNAICIRSTIERQRIGRAVASHDPP